MSIVNFNTKPVNVTAVYAPDGRFKPIFIRYIFPDESEKNIKISSVKYYREYKEYFLFCCVIDIGNRQNEIFLMFYLKEHTWLLKLP